MLKDWRRINVSFTRARSKLVIIGSRKTLQTTALLDEFFKLMDGRGWILALPAGADKQHELLCERAPSPKKRKADEETDDLASEPSTPGGTKKARKGGVSVDTLMKGRHILKDLVNDTS